ncbi:nucleotidyltransferase domain-containing protein [Alkalilimnicola ehrlichii]|uniref:nucleotidyltransferase domain-containing protein n=1 Tax=Alkalilimnicola ehrlichii TaxID=351052 RepID=UPI0011C0181E|nr:nucleotidyltransferase domain-containing protein [Alkalilimnicola ehrlichii]
MKTDISHLPDNKQRELRLIVETITALVDVELIVLFGSYARGNWVEDSYVEGHITYEYRSDYDLLVVTDLVRTKKSKPLWSKVEQRVHEHPALKTWPNLIVEDCGRYRSICGKGITSTPISTKKASCSTTAVGWNWSRPGSWMRKSVRSRLRKTLIFGFRRESKHCLASRCIYKKACWMTLLSCYIKQPNVF